MKNTTAWRNQEIARGNLEDIVDHRVDQMGFTPVQIDFIFADWSNMSEHLIWLLTATKQEIIDWGEAANWGVEENS